VARRLCIRLAAATQPPAQRHAWVPIPAEAGGLACDSRSPSSTLSLCPQFGFNARVSLTCDVERYLADLPWRLRSDAGVSGMWTRSSLTGLAKACELPVVGMVFNRIDRYLVVMRPTMQRRSSFRFLQKATSICVLDVTGLTEGGSRSSGISISSRQRPSRLSSPANCVRIPREPRKSLPAAFHFVPAPGGVPVDRLRSIDRHRGRDRRGPSNRGMRHMATIGTFASTGNGLGHVLRSVL